MLRRCRSAIVLAWCFTVIGCGPHVPSPGAPASGTTTPESSGVDTGESAGGSRDDPSEDGGEGESYRFDLSQVTIGRVPEDTLGMPVDLTIEIPPVPEEILGPFPMEKDEASNSSSKGS